MLMREVPIGDMVFLEERLDAEVRETFYTRNGDATYLQHGCVQGAPELAVRRFNDIGRIEKPRFIRFVPAGFQYPMVGALPVKPLSASRFYQHLKTSGAVADAVALKSSARLRLQKPLNLAKSLLDDIKFNLNAGQAVSLGRAKLRSLFQIVDPL